MPIEIPRIQRIEPQSTTGRPQQGRIQPQVQDSAASITGRTQALGQLGQTGANIYQAVEDEKITQLSREGEREYNTWNKSELNKLKKIEGDPTEAYVNYEKAAKEKEQEILSRNSGLSGRVQRHFKRNMDEVMSGAKLDAQYQRGAQMETYKHNLFESTVALKREQMADKAGYIQAGDPSTYAPLEKVRNDIITEIAKRGIEKQTVEVLPDDAESFSHSWQELDDEGNLKTVKVRMSNMAKLRVAKEMSKGLTDSIDAMIAAGQVEAAKEMKQKYASFIDAKNEAKLNRRFKTEDVSASAYSEFDKIRYMNTDQQLNAIDKIRDPEIRDKTLAIKDAHDRRIENARKRKNKVNEDNLTKYVLKNRDKFFGVADLENDPMYKQLVSNMDKKGVDNVRKLVEAPTKSTLKAQTKLRELFLNEDVREMNPEDFAKHIVDLDETDRRAAWKEFDQKKNGVTEPYISAHRKAKDLLTQTLYAQGLIKRKKRGSGINDDDLPKYNQALLDLTDYLDAEGVTNKTPPSKIKDHVEEYVKEAKKAQLFGSSGGAWSAIKGFFSDEDTPAATPIGTVKNPLEGKDNKEITKLRLKYKVRAGLSALPAENDPAFLEYVREEG